MVPFLLLVVIGLYQDCAWPNVPILVYTFAIANALILSLTNHISLSLSLSLSLLSASCSTRPLKMLTKLMSCQRMTLVVGMNWNSFVDNWDHDGQFLPFPRGNFLVLARILQTIGASNMTNNHHTAEEAN
jgi:hypothetical protein